MGDLKVADNISVLSSSYREYLVREKRLITETNQLLRELGIAIDASRYASELSFFETAVVELIRAVRSGAQLIITDELANLLNTEELSTFQRLLKHYAEKGISFLYIAGNPQELYQVCQRIILFEKGRILRVVKQKDFSPDLLNPYRPPHTFPPGPANASHDAGSVFRCEELAAKHLAALSFTVEAGECLTILNPEKHGIQDPRSPWAICAPLRGGLSLKVSLYPHRCAQSPAAGIAFILKIRCRRAYSLITATWRTSPSS